MILIKKRISVVIPIYCEELLIDELYRRITIAIESLMDQYEFEIIFVNDGSTDNSYQILKFLCEKDRRLKLLNLSRNFGHQLAITAGIDFASGSGVIVMDGDLQDPPEIIEKLIEKWESGYQVVYAERSERKGETLFKKTSASLFYSLLDFLTDIPIPKNVGDYRIMDRCVVDELYKLRESSRYIRGLVSWVGFKQCGISYTRDPRYAGNTKYSFSKMLKLALDGIINFSERPLYLAAYVGFMISLSAFMWGVVIIYDYYLGNFQGVLGWSSIMIAILLIGGLQIAFIGMIGLYLARTYSEVRRRPLYVVGQKIGFEDTL